MNTIEYLSNLKKELVARYYCLEEVWQRGYSLSYRWYRLKEAFGKIERQVNILNVEGSFTWDFGCRFFIETKGNGNWIWSCPDYYGDNTLTQYFGTYDEWIGYGGLGRDKGRHIIGEYCGRDVVINKQTINRF